VNLFLDIETIPTQRQDVCEYIEQSMRDDLMLSLEAVCAPANYKDEAKIAEYIATKRAALTEEFRAKLADKIGSTGLDGSFGQVFCIGWAFNDLAPCTVCGLEEAPVLSAFARQLPASDRFTTTVIGHNVSAFDLRFLTQRYIVNRIKPPMVIARAAQAKPWESEKVFDTMVQWSGVKDRIALDKLCLALSIPSPKGDLDGSKVWEYVQAGKLTEVAAYCERDVEAVRAVWRRMTFATVPQFEDVAA
jgi:hypothetical protein